MTLFVRAAIKTAVINAIPCGYGVSDIANCLREIANDIEQVAAEADAEGED